MTEKWKNICNEAGKLPENILDKISLFLEAANDPELDVETTESLLKARCITEHDQSTLLKIIIERFEGKDELQQAAKKILEILKKQKETKYLFPPLPGDITCCCCESWKPPCCR